MTYGDDMKKTIIPISAIVGGGICVAASDGQKIYALLQKAVAEDNRVTLSFSGVTRMTTAFLNAAVGQLYGEFSERVIKRCLAPPTDFEEWHLQRLKIVVERAKIYFEDAEKFEKTIMNSLGETDDENN